MLMRCRSCARICVKETVTNLEFEEKGETDEGDILVTIKQSITAN
jgi:hypothetical protein